MVPYYIRNHLRPTYSSKLHQQNLEKIYYYCCSSHDKVMFASLEFNILCRTVEKMSAVYRNPLNPRMSFLSPKVCTSLNILNFQLFKSFVIRSIEISINRHFPESRESLKGAQNYSTKHYLAPRELKIATTSGTVSK